MKASRKLVTSGLALVLLLGGGALYAFADSGSPAPSQTQQQTQAKAEHPGWHGQGKGPFVNGETGMKSVADILGMQPEDVKAQLQSGKSLADIAQSKGISEADLIAKLTAQAQQKLDTAVKNGKLTQAKADELKQKMSERIKQTVERKGLPEWKKNRHGGHGAVMMKRSNAQIASWLGISQAELEAQLKTGKSLADIAAEHGKTKDQLIAKLKEDMTPMLDKFVTQKRGEKAQSDK